MSFIQFDRIPLCRALVIAFVAGASPALAQAPAPSAAPAPAKPVDPAYEAAKNAFEALPEGDRIAIQDALIWTGDYKNMADGKFGRGTKESIVAFATRNKLPSDGTLDAKARGALYAAAKAAKDAAQFAIKTDEKTGIRIGLPLKLLGKPTPSPTGQRYASADGSFSILLTQKPATDTALQENYEAMTKPLSGGKVTYKLLKPDFFVVAGEQGKSAFYTRMAKGDQGGKTSLAAMTVNYPLDAKAKYEPLLIAIANSFAPFAGGAPTQGAVPQAAAQPTTPSTAPSAAPAATQKAAVPNANAVPAQSERSLSATGIAVAPGYILTSLPKVCTAPQTGAKALKVVKQGASDGLTLLAPADPKDKDLAAKTLQLASGDPADESTAVVLAFNHAGTTDDLLGAPGSLRKADGTSWRLLAPLQNPVAGSAVFDADGSLLALVGAPDIAEKTIAGVLPQKNRTVVSAAKLAAFASDIKLTVEAKSSATAKARTVGEIASANRNALFPITCLR